MNGDVQSDLATLAFNNGEQLEYFNGSILRLQQEIMLSGEILYPAKIVFQYIKLVSKSDELRDSIAPKMTYLITLTTTENLMYIQEETFMEPIII